MRDRRSVDTVSAQELEQIIRLRRQAARLQAATQRGTTREGTPAIPGVSVAIRRRRTGLDLLLLVAELAVAIGLGYVLMRGAGVLRTLNTEVANALAPPTLTPTPLVVPVFLPDSHTPPNSPGGAQPYEASLPEGIRFLATPVPAAFAPLLPTPGPEQARHMKIPALNIDAPVVQGIEWEQLKKGIGQVPGTADPGQVGNGVYAAHNDTYGELFRHLHLLRRGDEVLIYTATQEIRYVVREWRIVEPTEVSVMSPTPTPTITLISCWPYLVDTQRIVVFGDLVTGAPGQ